MDRLTHDDCYEELSNEPMFSKAIRKLKEYEDAEEAGLLVRLPCKEGTLVYGLAYGQCFKCATTDYQTYISCKAPADSYCVKSHVVEIPFEYEMNDKMGKTVFLTPEAAEAALAKEVDHE